MLRAFLGPAEDGNTVSMTVVTTMWDTVCTERTRQRAESNFAQLSDEIFKAFKYPYSKGYRTRNLTQDLNRI